MMKKQALAQASFTPGPEHWPEKVDSAWQEQMVVQYAPLIKYIASRLALRLPSHISLDDLISSGIIGLIDELRSLDWIPRSVRKKSHVLEKAYAELERNLGRPAEPEEVCHILGLELEEFYQLLDETKTVSLVELEGVWRSVRNGPDLPDSDLPEILLDESVRDPFISLHFSELQDIMVRAIDALPDKEKLLISLYYYEELTMKEIGQIMGYTESRISQLHTQAMVRLRSRLREYFHGKEE